MLQEMKDGSIVKNDKLYNFKVTSDSEDLNNWISINISKPENNIFYSIGAMIKINRVQSRNVVSEFKLLYTLTELAEKWKYYSKDRIDYYISYLNSIKTKYLGKYFDSLSVMELHKKLIDEFKVAYYNILTDSQIWGSVE